MCIAVLVISVVSTDLFTWLYTNKIGTHCETFSDFRTFFIALASMSVFLMAMKMKMPKQRMWITAISKHSFNVYMMHVFFLDILQQNIDPAKVSSWWGTPVFFIFMFSLSFAMSWIYEKAKGKKINAI